MHVITMEKAVDAASCIEEHTVSTSLQHCHQYYIMERVFEHFQFLLKVF
jgi:hypothetical protein